MNPTSKLIEPWRERISNAAGKADIDPYLLAGIVVQESGGEQYAQRVERGFWSRYLDGIRRWVQESPSRYDDKWAAYPDIYASSYGLCQIMLQTAAEHGFVYHYPGQLFDPDENLRVACKILSRLRVQKHGDTRAMLLAYNGGGDPTYPDRISNHVRALKEDRVFG